MIINRIQMYPHHFPSSFSFFFFFVFVLLLFFPLRYNLIILVQTTPKRPFSVLLASTRTFRSFRSFRFESGTTTTTKKVTIIFVRLSFGQMLRDNMMRGSKTGQPVVLIFDWSRAAQTVFVNKAAASTRTAGLLLALFLYRLHVLHKVSLDRVHLIGHSFGAEIAAVAGRALRKLTGRKLFAITGLDPAGICVTYGGRRPVHCLRYQDAQLVRVLHSDALYFGTASPVGHFDVYLNGGRFQPHCFPHASAIFNPEGKHFTFHLICLSFFFRLANRFEQISHHP